MNNDELMKALTGLEGMLSDTPAYVRGSAALRVLVPDAVTRPVRDIDLICSAAVADEVVGKLTSLGVFAQTNAKDLVTEGVRVGYDLFFEPVGQSDSQRLPVDLVVVTTTSAEAYFDQLSVAVPGAIGPVMDLAMLVVDKAKLLCPTASGYAANRGKDLVDLANIASVALPEEDKLEIAVEACSALWNWRDWSGFPVVPSSWASDVRGVELPSQLLAMVAEAAGKVAARG